MYLLFLEAYFILIIVFGMLCKKYLVKDFRC